MFVKASRMKLSVQTPKGNLYVQDLWDLSLTDLNITAKNLRRLLKNSQEEDFLEEKSPDDETNKLRFDIVIFILETKKAEKKAAEQEVVLKSEKERILGLIAKKRDASLEAMSEEELQKKLDEINGQLKK